MPAHREIREAIVSEMAAVAGIGPVHSFERYAVREADFQALYVHDGQLRGWNVRRVSTRETSPALGRFVVTHRWRLVGFMAIRDAEQSELAFDDLVEAVRDRFRADLDLGGVVVTTQVDGVAGAQLDDAGPVMFAGVLCHQARLTLFTRHHE